MKKAKALELLNKQLNEIPILKTVKEEDKRYQEWKEETISTIKVIFGNESNNYRRMYERLFDEGLIVHYGKLDYHALYLSKLENTDSILHGMIVEVKTWEDDKDDTSNTEYAINTVRVICNHFHQGVRQLKKRYNNRPTIDVNDEYDVQDLLHAFLRLHFDDVRAEECTPSYAGSASRMDFLLKKEKIVIEVKKTRKNLGAKEVGEQLMIDIERYTAHPDCDTLICFVYDPDGRVANPVGIENDLNRNTDNLKVITIITPK